MKKYFSSSSKKAGPNTESPQAPRLKKSLLWSLQAVETLRIWKWNNSEAMKVKFPPPAWNHSNQYFYGWSMAGEKEKWSGLQKCEVSQEVPSSPPSFPCSCYFFWTIDSISSCNSSQSAKSQGSWSCRQLTARSSSSVLLWSLLQLSFLTLIFLHSCPPGCFPFILVFRLAWC